MPRDVAYEKSVNWLLSGMGSCIIVSCLKDGSIKEHGSLACLVHQVTIRFSDRGTPDGYRHMDGFSSHTFSLINANNELFYVKWHFKTKQGIKTITGENASAMRGIDPEDSQRDLFDAIKKGDFPKWKVAMQIMPEKEAETYHINPFDLTKVWPHGDYPLIEVGELTLDRNPENYFAEVEQAAFEPRTLYPAWDFRRTKCCRGG